MVLTTEQIIIFVMGMFTAGIVWSIYIFVVGLIYGYPTRISEKKINELIDRLQSQGFIVYQAITGCKPMTMQQAEDTTLLKSQGYLVFNNRGWEGFLLRPRLTSNEKADLRRSKFKLVVSNEPNE
jgi:hypothetical protein